MKRIPTWKVECPRCGAQPTYTCESKRGKPLVNPHLERRQRARDIKKEKV